MTGTMAAPGNLAIQGWMSEAELEWLASMAAGMGSIAEIGSWKGRSTFALLFACPGPVYAIDHWMGSPGELDSTHREIQDGADVYAEFRKNVGHFPNLRVIQSDSVAAAQIVPDVDMVFIDGAHDYAQVAADIRAWLPKARRMICGHDAWYDTVVRAVWNELGHLKVCQGAHSIWYATIG